MSSQSGQPAGRFFEEFEVGQTMVSRARTITEADIVQFGTLTGDFNSMHFDAEYMRGHMLGQRVAHGMLSLSYALGQAYQLGFMEKTVLAFRSLEIKFSVPVYIGDTIHAELTVKETKAAKRLGGGTVTLGLRVLNQEGKAVHKGDLVVLVASKENAE